jgi:glycerophosphoryl diester phosphodiesterase
MHVPLCFLSFLYTTVDAIELDVWLTADDEVAVFHDGSLDRCIGVSGHIRDLTSQQLRTTFIKQEPSDGFEQGAGEAPLAPQHIPLLDEVLALIKPGKNQQFVRGVP